MRAGDSYDAAAHWFFFTAVNRSFSERERWGVVMSNEEDAEKYRLFQAEQMLEFYKLRVGRAAKDMSELEEFVAGLSKSDDALLKQLMNSSAEDN